MESQRYSEHLDRWRRSTALGLIGSVLCAIAAAQTSNAAQFDVWEYRVDGNALLSQRDVEATLYPLLGSDKSLDDVEAARRRLEEVYRSRGYPAVTVSIPEQNVEHGIVRLSVLEGRVDRVRVKGSRYYANDEIRKAVPSLAQGSPLHVPSVSEDLSALQQRAPDRVIRPVLRAGKAPGTVDVDLDVEDRLPLHGSVEVNNRATADTSKTRLDVSLGYDNLWQRDHSVRLVYQTSPEEPDEVKVFAGTYLYRFQNSPTLLAFTYVDNQSEVASVSDSLVIGKGKVIGTRVIVPLPGHGSWFQSLSFGYDYKDFDDTVSLLDGTGLETPVTYGNASVEYGFGKVGETSRLQASLSANMGLRGVFNTPDEFEDKRFKGNANYLYLRGESSFQKKLPRDYSLNVALAGQLSQDALISNEQYAIGGWGSVRGYYEAEELGDFGTSLQIELQSPNLAHALGNWGPFALTDANLTLFVDAGFVGIQDPLPDQDDQTRLSSAGLGIRLRGAPGWDGYLFWAHPLEAGASTASSDSRALFSMTYGF